MVFDLLFFAVLGAVFAWIIWEGLIEPPIDLLGYVVFFIVSTSALILIGMVIASPTPLSEQMWRLRGAVTGISALLTVVIMFLLEFVS